MGEKRTMQRLTILLTIILLITAGCLFDPDTEPIVTLDADLHTIEDVKQYIATQDFPDCIRAANTALIALHQIGMNAFKVDLYGDGSPHQICIGYSQPNEWHLFSNNEYGLILSNDWRVFVIQYFGETYNRIDVVLKPTHNQGEIR